MNYFLNRKNAASTHSHFWIPKYVVQLVLLKLNIKCFNWKFKNVLNISEMSFNFVQNIISNINNNIIIIIISLYKF